MQGLSNEMLLALGEIAELTKGGLLSGNTSRGAVCTAGLASGDTLCLKGREQGSSCLASGLGKGGPRQSCQARGQDRVRLEPRPGPGTGPGVR